MCSIKSMACVQVFLPCHDIALHKFALVSSHLQSRPLSQTDKVIPSFRNSWFVIRSKFHNLELDLYELEDNINSHVLNLSVSH